MPKCNLGTRSMGELHQEELLADWNLLQEGKRPAPIDPLR